MKARIESLESDLRQSSTGREAEASSLREKLSGELLCKQGFELSLGKVPITVTGAEEALREVERERECLLERERSQKDLEQQMISYEKELQASAVVITFFFGLGIIGLTFSPSKTDSSPTSIMMPFVH